MMTVGTLPGLDALKMLAAHLGEVYVLAPLEPHSVCGPSRYRRMPLYCSPKPRRTSTPSAALPADCVRVAMTEIFPQIDWVLAGINRGGNLGADLFTSGTVAAAREAALLGSLPSRSRNSSSAGLTLDWSRSRELALPVLKDLILQEPRRESIGT